jgi:DNA-directed RNA polymerase subunit RPC12/RpoP
MSNPTDPLEFLNGPSEPRLEAKRPRPVGGPVPSPQPLIVFCCPRCGRELEAERRQVGTRLSCPICNGPVVVPCYSQPRAGIGPYRLSVGRAVALVATVCGILGAVIGAAIGAYVSQYHPVFGGLAVMGDPWSPARQSLIGPHVLAFGGVSGLLAGGIPAVLTYLVGGHKR